VGAGLSKASCWYASVALAGTLGAPLTALGCACGCGVFDVGVGSMFPTQSGPMAFLEEDYMDQDRNWSGTASAPAQDNSDKRIRTFFTTVGAQYLFDRSWGAIIEIPYWQRQFTTTLADGSIGTFSHAAPGDIRLKGVYTGFSADLSTGITFGVKLPTGDSSYPHFDPDTEIGSGSTDLLLGAYHLGALTADNRWSWFADAQWQRPLLHKAAYRPGAELDAAGGLYYGGLTLGTMRVTPIVQLELAYRLHDGGPQGDPLDTGYVRAYAALGLEVDSGRARLYVDVALPVYTNASGNQLVASALLQMNVAVSF
jgi:hypothetical protein